MAGVTYTKPDPETVGLLNHAMKLYHERLKLAEVTIGVLAAHGPVSEETGERTGPAIKHHGIKALAKVRIVSLRDRAHGLPDAEILIDGDEWPMLSRQQRIALFDHELTHLELAGETDDLGRPKLKIRQHDFQVGWFHEVAERHGSSSIEVQQAQQFADEHGQLYLFVPPLPPTKAKRPPASRAVAH